MSFFKYLFLGLIVFTPFTYGAVGKISALKGESYLERDQHRIVLKNALPIEERDTLMTEIKAQVQMLFFDNTVITIGSNTVFKVEEYLFDETNAKAKFALKSGIFKAITGKIGKKAPENFSIRTKTAVIGIRGTTIRGKITENADVIMCDQGIINVTSLITNQTYIIPAGKMIILSHDGTSVEILNVTPEELKKMGIEEEFLFSSSSSVSERLQIEDLQSLNAQFQSQSVENTSTATESASDALDRNLQTQHDDTLNALIPLNDQIGGPTAGP